MAVIKESPAEYVVCDPSSPDSPLFGNSFDGAVSKIELEDWDDGDIVHVYRLVEIRRLSKGAVWNVEGDRKKR